MSKITRRQVLALGATAGLAPQLALAEEFPSRPIRIVVGVPPGGSIDYGARLISTALGETLGTSVIVENKAGAAGVLASDYVAKSAADGYTLLLGTPSPIIVAPQAMPSTKFNPLTELAAINTISTSPIAVCVNPKLPVKRLKDLVAFSKQRQVRVGLPLVGSVSHLVMEMIAKATGANFLMVPYKGGGPALTDTIAGHVDATVSDVGVFLPMHKEGRVRIVLVTSEKRIPSLPDVPTANEDSPGLVVTNWLGIFAPANTPAPVLQKINTALVKSVARKDVRDGFDKASATASAMQGPEQFQKFVASEYLRYGRILRERNIVIE